MDRKIVNVISSQYVPQWGNDKKFIAVHYLGVDGQNYNLGSDGCGAHFTIYWDGTIYQRCDLDAIVWQVGTAGYYTQKHPTARNKNTIGIELCCHCDGNKSDGEDPKWYFTKETQEAAVWLIKKLMEEQNIPIGNVLRHYDIVNKTCPNPYVLNNKYKTSWTWNEFKSKIISGDTETSEPVITNGTQASAFAGLNETEAADKIVKMVYETDKSGILPSVSAAQMILESGYAKTELAANANNCFGMKTMLSENTWAGSSWDGKSKYTKRTAEQNEDGTVYYVDADFRKYPCIEDSIKDHSAYLLGAMNGTKLRYEGLTDAKDYKEAIQIIKDGGYATDISYVSKICTIIEKYSLDKYDTASNPIEPDTEQPWYRVRKTWADAKTQLGAFHDLNKAKVCVDANTGYSVFDESGKSIYSNVKPETDVSYLVRVEKGIRLNIRKGPGTNYASVGVISETGVYTIIEESTGDGSTKGWGRLRSGAGWISLDFVTKIR